MKFRVLSACALLLAVAVFSSANGEWYWVGCSGTYNMGGSGGMDLIPCAISRSTGGGGSKIITHNDYYCLKFTEWRADGDFRLHVKLYKGASCSAWSDGDYCYEHPSDCDKYIDWGDDVELGDPYPYHYYIALTYTHSQWGPLVVSHGGSPLVNKMGFKIRVTAMQGKSGRKGLVNQASRIPSVLVPAVKQSRTRR